MPFIVPRYKRFFHETKYVTLESSKDFHLQERKKAVSATPIAQLRRPPPEYRITHSSARQRGFYVVAEGDSMKQMRQGPWKYVSTVLQSKLPQHLSRDRIVRWLLGHFTQLAMESGQPNDKMADEDVHVTNKIIFPDKGSNQDNPFNSAAPTRDEVGNSSSQMSVVASTLNKFFYMWLTEREIMLLVLFSGILAIFMKDVSMFGILLAVLNTCMLISVRSAAHLRPVMPQPLSHPETDKKEGPLISPMVTQYGPEAEMERVALLHRAEELEAEVMSDESGGGPTGELADELSVIYQAIANLTVGGIEINTAPSIPMPSKLELAQGAPSRETDLQPLSSAAADATKTSADDLSYMAESECDNFSKPKKRSHLMFEGLNAPAPRYEAPYTERVSAVTGSKFMLRGPNYLVDKIKAPSGPPMYDFVGWDAFAVKKKFYHGARFLTLPLSPSKKAEAAAKKKELSAADFDVYVQDTLKELHTPVAGLPRTLIVNLQAPNYDPFIYGGPWDGPGFAVCAYFTLSDAVIRQLETTTAAATESDTGSSSRPPSPHLSPRSSPQAETNAASSKNVSVESADGTSRKPYAHPNALRLLQKAMQDDLLTANDRSTFLGRMKVCPICFNLDEVESISAFVRNSLGRFNGKPLLSAPKQKFYRGNGYMEFTLDLHVYNYLQRSLSAKSRSMYSEGRLGMGFTFEGRDKDELPEQMMACVEIDKLDFFNLTPVENVYVVPDDRTPGQDICAA